MFSMFVFFCGWVFGFCFLFLVVVENNVVFLSIFIFKFDSLSKIIGDYWACWLVALCFGLFSFFIHVINRLEKHVLFWEHKNTQTDTQTQTRRVPVKLKSKRNPNAQPNEISKQHQHFTNILLNHRLIFVSLLKLNHDRSIERTSIYVL